VKEKLLAAHRVGITTVVIPKENAKDLVELPEDVKQALSIHTVDSVDEVWQIALEGPIPVVKADVPTTEVPIWGQPPANEASSSNPAIE
jgi:ATP-dependent Lon protease